MNLIFLGIIMLFSCRVTKNDVATEIFPLELNNKYSFSNSPYKLDSTARKTDNFALDRKNTTLTGLFRIQNINANNICIQVDKEDTLRIFINDTIAKTFAFKVKRKGKYYEYFAERKIIEIPPIISFFYGKRQVDRLRLALTEKRELLIKNKYVDHNNILFLGGGGEYNQSFLYKSILPE
jgi:hypothetical protein